MWMPEAQSPSKGWEKQYQGDLAGLGSMEPSFTHQARARYRGVLAAAKPPNNNQIFTVLPRLGEDNLARTAPFGEWPSNPVRR